MESLDDRSAALRTIAWLLVGWALALAALGLAYEIEYERMLDAIRRAPHRELLHQLVLARGAADLVVATAVVAVALLRRSRAVAGPAIAFGTVGLLQVLMWLRPGMVATRWMFALRVIAGAAAWLTVIVALARLPAGRRARVSIAGGAVSLVLWRYGVPLWAGLFGGLAMPETRPLLWALAQAVAIVGVGGAVAYLASGTGRASVPPNLAATIAVALFLFSVAVGLHEIWPTTRFEHLPVALLVAAAGCLVAVYVATHKRPAGDGA